METKFGAGVGRLEWLEDEGSWSLNGMDGQNLGHFKGVIASDKNVFSPRFTDLTGRPPPLGKTAFLSALVSSKFKCRWYNDSDIVIASSKMRIENHVNE